MVPLNCESCGSLLESEDRDVAFRCTNCGQGYALLEGELKRLTVKSASPKLQERGEVQYYPFWVLKAEVTVESREASGGFFSGLLRGGGSGPAGGTIAFYIPAFDAPLEVLKQLSVEFTKEQPSYEIAEEARKSIKGCVHSEEFARGFADFVFLTMEAERPDTMKSIRYSIKFLEATVLAVPFVSVDGSKKDLLMGKQVMGW